MDSCLTTLALLAIVIGLIYLFLVWNFGYWKKRGIKEAKSLPFLGSFPSQFTHKRHLVYDVDEIYKQYKKDEHFVGIYSSRLPHLLILSPEWSRKILVNDFKHFHDNEWSNFVDKKSDPVFGNNTFIIKGEGWKIRRAEITPGLSASRIKSVYPVTETVCKQFNEYIRKQMKMAAKDGLDAKELCLRYTTEVVTDCVLGVKAGSFMENPTPVFQTIKTVFDQSGWFFFFTFFANLLPQIRKIYLPRFFNKQAEVFFCNLMQTSIDLRRKSNVDRSDFLGYMLQLQDKKGLTTIELTAHTLTFLTDGFETTSLVLAHTLLFLGRYPEVQEKLRHEIESITDPADFDIVSELPYLDACLHETMRIFPPQLVFRKLCTIPYEITNKDGTKVQLNVDDVVHIPAFSFHHDPDIYENPEAYIPERFLAENSSVKSLRDEGIYLGFGDGPRICLGARFALTQMKAALVEILRDFNIKVNPKTRKDNLLHETYFMGILHGGIWLDFESRK